MTESIDDNTLKALCYIGPLIDIGPDLEWQTSVDGKHWLSSGNPPSSMFKYWLIRPLLGARK